MTTFAEFAEGLLIDGGRPLDLEPFQIGLLESLERGDRLLSHGELELASRRYGRRYRTALTLAAASLGGHDVRLVSTDSQAARDTYDLAIKLLGRYAESASADVDLAARRLEQTLGRPATDVAPRQTNDPRHAGGSKCITPSARAKAG